MVKNYDAPWAEQTSAPSNPGSGSWKIYFKSGGLYVLEDDGTEHGPFSASVVNSTTTLNFIIDGGGSAITTGIKGDIVVDFAATIKAATLLADQSGDIVVDIWKDTYANFPPTDADSITASAPPTLSSATKDQDTTLTGWTTAIAAGDVLRINVDSAATVTLVTLSLELERA